MQDKAIPEIDFGPLNHRLGYLLRRAQIAVFQDFYAAAAQFEISPGEYSALTLIASNPGLSQTQIAEALGIKKPNFVALARRLERRGLVLRQATKNDRRSYAMTLSAEGNKFLCQLEKAVDAHEQKMILLIGKKNYDDWQPLLGLLARMNISG